MLERALMGSTFPMMRLPPEWAGLELPGGVLLLNEDAVDDDMAGEGRGGC